MDKVADFFKNAFDDMAENARIQHEADKTNFEAARLESRSNREHIKNRPLRDLAEAKTQKKAAQEQLRHELGARNAMTGKADDDRGSRTSNQNSDN